MTAPDNRVDLIQLRRDTAADWAAADPVLAAGEPGWDTTAGALKIGDGTTAWSALPALTGGGGGDATDQYAGPLLAELVDTSTSSRTAISATAGVVPFDPGAWVVVDASLSAASSGILVALPAATHTSGADSSTLLQFATGGAGAEVVWATIAIGYRVAGPAGFVPGNLPIGTRVSVRCISGTSLRAVSACYEFVPDRSVALGAPVTWGANTAAAKGVSLTPPGGLNVKGGWTQLVAATTQDVSVLSLWPQGDNATALQAQGVLLDIGVGAAGAEVVVLPDIYLLGHTSEAYQPMSPLNYGVAIPNGSRVAARFSRNHTNLTVDLTAVAA